jgi:septal ring factor EnvC (AmiA/AmiB activator)
LRTSPAEAWALRALVSLKYSSLKSARIQQDLAMGKEKRLQNVRKMLVGLKTEQEQEIQRQKKSQAEKSQLYKTTQGKRIIAEQEAQRLIETREELEKMISGLAEKREKSLAALREAELLKKTFYEKRGNLPWPAEGTVVSQFGRRKHADLNITVINSGIKIRTSPSSPVRSVERGTVIYAADFRSYGQTVIVDHGGDSYSVYGLMGNLLVKEGEKIPLGKILGASSPEEGSQIYFELRNQGKSENPLLWLKQ